MLTIAIKVYCVNVGVRTIAPRSGLGFGLGLALELGLGAVFLGGTCPRTVNVVVDIKPIYSNKHYLLLFRQNLFMFCKNKLITRLAKRYRLYVA